MKKNALIGMLIFLTCFWLDAEAVTWDRERNKPNSLTLLPVEEKILGSIPEEATETQKGEYYAKVVRLYRNHNDTNAVIKIISYSKKVLQEKDLPVSVLCDTITVYDKALLIQYEQSGLTNALLLETRLNYYLDGLALCIDHLKVAERVPLRGVERFDVPPGSPMRAEFEKRHAEQVAYAEYADEQNKLLTFRNSFLQSIFVLCNPNAFENYDFNKKLLKLGYPEEKATAVCAVLRDAAQKNVESKRIWKPSPHNIHPNPANSTPLKINAVP